MGLFEKPDPNWMGIFLLNRDSRGRLCYNPWTHTSLALSERDWVTRMIRFQRSPTRVPIDDKDRTDLAYAIGALFDHWRVVSTNKRIQQMFLGHSPRGFLPWEYNSIIRLRGWAGPEGTSEVTVTSTPPDDPIALKLQQRVREFATLPANGVRGPFLLSVDSRLLQKVGDLTRAEALQFLRGLLETNDWLAVAAAIEALMRLRDVESIERVRQFSPDFKIEGETPSGYHRVVAARRMFLAGSERGVIGSP